ncbi:MAG: hypothetical protein SNJ85_11055 [Cyanobacteriota bacterium]
MAVEDWNQLIHGQYQIVQRLRWRSAPCGALSSFGAKLARRLVAVEDWNSRHPEEKEFLYPLGQTFYIIKVERTAKKATVYLKEYEV